VLLRHATSVLAEMSHAELELTGLDQRLENQVRIGVHPIAAASIVIPAVACFRERMPEAHLEIDEGQTQTLLPLLKRGEYDFLVSTVPDEPGASLTFDVLFGSRNGIFVRKQHPLAAVTAPSFEAVTSHPWIYPLPHAHRTKEMENLFSLNAVRRPPVGLSTMSPELSRHALLNNNWVILTQGELLLEELVQGRVVELKTSEVLRDVAIAIAERSATNHSEAAEVLISCIRQEAKNYIKTW